jgi:hypothetical protein
VDYSGAVKPFELDIERRHHPRLYLAADNVIEIAVVNRGRRPADITLRDTPRRRSAPARCLSRPGGRLEPPSSSATRRSPWAAGSTTSGPSPRAGPRRSVCSGGSARSRRQRTSPSTRTCWRSRSTTSSPVAGSCVRWGCAPPAYSTAARSSRACASTSRTTTTAASTGRRQRAATVRLPRCMRRSGASGCS